MDNVIILLEIFFGLSGIYSIIAFLNRLKKNNSQSSEPHSSIQTKWFKWLAPAGFIYGALSIIGTIFLIRFDSTGSLKTTIFTLQERVKQLEDDNRRLYILTGDTSGSTTSSFCVTFWKTGSKPILGGRILIIYESDRFIFSGSQGVAGQKDWQYVTNVRELIIPDKFFMKISYHEIWGINVFRNEDNYLTLQFYHP